MDGNLAMNSHFENMSEKDTHDAIDDMHERKKIEELVKLRYKVISDYPFSPFLIGAILHPIEPVTDPLTKSLHLYPHLFQKLEWWEDRKPEEMPEYVKRCGFVLKFVRIDKPNPGKKVTIIKTKGAYKEFTTNSNFPATSAEYHTFLNSKINN